MPKIFFESSLVDSLIGQNLLTKVDYFDLGCRGLQLEVRPRGATWYFRYKGLAGRIRQYRISDARDLSLPQVRKLVDQLRGQVALGNDPAQKRDSIKSEFTFENFVINRYLPYIKSYKRSWSTDECLLRNHLLPRFAGVKLIEFTKFSLMQMHQERLAEGASPNSANRLLILMRYIFNLAIKWEIGGLQKNPTNGIPLFAENNQRERYLKKEELNSLFRAIENSINPTLRYIIPMLALTGARRGEVLTCRWDDLSVEGRSWKIPISKSGKARFVPLSDAVISLLEHVPRYDGCPYVFPNPKTLKPYVAIYYSWHTARTQAGLSDVRIHDLRHTYASLLINNGRSLYEVQKILGHAQINTTQRYSHLSEVTLIDAANIASKDIEIPS